MHRILVSLLTAALLTAGAAVAQDYQAQRSSQSPLGTLSMPHDLAAEGGSATVSANVSLDIASARQAGAQYLSVTAGNDHAPSGVQISDLTLNANGQLPEPTWTDGEATHRQYKNYAIGDLPDALEGTVTFTASYPQNAGSFDVEIVILAMDDTYKAVSDGANSTYNLQSWTGIHPDGNVNYQADTNETATGNQTVDETGNTTDDETMNGADPGMEETGDGTLGDDVGQEQEVGEEETPAAGVALTTLALIGLALATRRRS